MQNYESHIIIIVTLKPTSIKPSLINFVIVIGPLILMFIILIFRKPGVIIELFIPPSLIITTLIIKLKILRRSRERFKKKK